MSFTGRLAILAGGLGGLGSVTGRLLRERGAHVALLYAPFEKARKDEILHETYGSTAAPGVTTYECDITSPESVNSAFKTIEHSLEPSGEDGSGKIFPNMMINAAGYVYVSPMEDQPPDEILTNLHANIYGPMLCSQAFAKLYWNRAQQASAEPPAAAKAAPDASDVPQSPTQPSQEVKYPPGRIVSISSQAAHKHLWGHAAYCASKSGLMGLTRAMASEWGSTGITATTVSPTVAWTTLGKKAWADKDRREAFMKTIPVGRFAEPMEIATAISWLCEDGNGMLNGTDIKVDGGFTVH
ncbi:MAG: hypothetical protein Q9162_006399 [Coniocarpon cinnabarinum]